MSINPVPMIGPESAAQFADANAQKHAPATTEAISGQPDPGTSPKQEAVPAQSSAPSTEVPEDEVQVQRDSATDGEIVVRYLDHSGNLILQVPSSQMLGVTRGIDQDFQREEKIRENDTVTPRNPGGNHGH